MWDLFMAQVKQELETDIHERPHRSVVRFYVKVMS